MVDSKDAERAPERQACQVWQVPHACYQHLSFDALL
jgi:hypothetical protein